MKIGPFEFQRYSGERFDPETCSMVHAKRELYITRDDGEGMGCNPETEKKLIEVLEKFWQENF